jgi:hypothetical protein
LLSADGKLIEPYLATLNANYCRIYQTKIIFLFPR